MKKVFTITVNHNCAHLIDRHLGALAAQQADARVTALVVDNASTDGSAALIRKRFPEVALIEPRVNLGFAAGANAGLARAAGEGADFALVMNPDVFPDPDYIEKMLDLMACTPDAGIAGGRLVREPGKDGVARLDSTGLFLRWDFFARDRGAGQPERGQFSDGDEEVFALCGAALFFRMAALPSIAGGAADGHGPFDSDFFMYGEDVDVCWRARRAGWESVYVPAARAVHLRGGAGGGSHRFRGQTPERARLTLRNRYAYLIKNLSPGPAELLRLAAAEIEVFCIMLARPKLFAVIADIWKNRAVLTEKRRKTALIPPFRAAAAQQSQ